MARPSQNLTANLRIRMTPEEKAQLEEQAAHAGRDLSTLARAQLLGAPIPRKARRVASVDQEALARILAQVNRLGGNINQLAKIANTGRAVDLETARAVKEAAAEVARMRDEIRAALQP